MIVLNNIIECNGEIYRLIAKMGNSYSSDVYKVTSKGNTYILKIPYNNQAYESEKIILEELERQGIAAPKIIKEVVCTDKKGIIMSYLQGLNGEEAVFTKRKIGNLVKTINEFQNITLKRSEIPLYNFDIIVNTYNENIELISDYVSRELYLAIQKNSDMFFDLLKEQQYNRLIHRDLRLGNIIMDSEKIFLIDFEGCAMGNPIMDLVKIYYEITFKDSNMGDFFLHEYVASNCIEKDLALRILKIYTILDKINSIIWCRNRKRVGSVFFKQSIEYLERNMKDGTRGYLF